MHVQPFPYKLVTKTSGFHNPAEGLLLGYPNFINLLLALYDKSRIYNLSGAVVALSDLNILIELLAYGRRTAKGTAGR